MANSDISRLNFNPLMHYTSVRWNQGIINSEEDHNDSRRIVEEENRLNQVDLIGGSGTTNHGFRLDNLRISDNKIDFDIHEGTMHLGGLRLEMHEKETYLHQKNWLQGPDVIEAPTINNLPKERYDLVYLEAWEQVVSGVEDNELIDVALGVPTTNRGRNMWRVKMKKNIGFEDCAKAWQQLKKEWEEENLGTVNAQHERIPDVRMRVSFTETGSSDDLCSPFTQGGYLGAENQAIRVQLTSRNTFTWGFDNAKNLYRAKVSQDWAVELKTGPKDQNCWLLAGQVVEILGWSAELANGEKIAEQSGYLAKVASSYDPDTHKFSLVPPVEPEEIEAWEKIVIGNLGQPYFFLCHWDRGEDLISKAHVEFTPGTSVPLGNTGLEVTITGNDLVENDRWLIAVRPKTPNVIIPKGLTSETGMPPIGVRRFFTPLGIFRWTNESSVVVGNIIHDCRKKFNPLTELDCCCTYTVGDGVHSKGDYSSIQEALDNLPESGGKICVLPGEHLANVRIFNRRQIHICGCGEHTIIRPHLEHIAEPIFRIEHSQKIKLDQMTLLAFKGTAIEVEDYDKSFPFSRGITISNNWLMALIHGIFIRMQNVAGDNQFRILHNQIGMIDKAEGEAAIFFLGDDALMACNRIVVVPQPGPDNPDDPGGDDVPPGGPHDPCADPSTYYEPNFELSAYTSYFFNYVTGIKILNWPFAYKAKGGVQIGGGSEWVNLLENEFIGGNGNGITFGHLAIRSHDSAPSPGTPDSPAPRMAVSAPNVQNIDNVIYNVKIKGNYIHRMGLSGIGVVSFFHPGTDRPMVWVENLEIYENIITNCAQQPPEKILDVMLDQIGFGGIGLAAGKNVIIQENRIEENGVSHLYPVCGIFFQQVLNVKFFHNLILNNGPRTTNSDLQMRSGTRGGIHLKNASNLYSAGGPAVVIQGNTIDVPVGQCLFIIGKGPFSVVGNQLISHGIDVRNIFSSLAGAVFIFNLGISKDFLRVSLFKFQDLVKINPFLVGSNLGSNLSNIKESGLILYADNQITLNPRSPAFSSQIIASLDGVTYNNNQTECVSYLPMTPRQADQVIFDVYLHGWSVQSIGNLFQEGVTSTKYSLLSYGYMNMALGNQATHCLHVLGTKLPSEQVLESNNVVLFSDPCKADKAGLSLHLNVPVGNELATDS